MYSTIIKTDEKEVISSGVVISFDSKPILIEVFEETQSILKLQFVFETDLTTKEVLTETRVEGDIMSIVLTNYHNPIGTGTTTPVHFAQYKGKQLYIHFKVDALSEKADKCLYYSIYLTGGNNGGK